MTKTPKTLNEIYADDDLHILKRPNESAFIYECKRLVYKLKLKLKLIK